MTGISSSPKVDSKAVAEDFVNVFTRVMKRSSAPMVDFAERYELSFTQLKLIFALANAEEPLPIGHVAEMTGGSLPATGRAIDGLVRHGLATRTEDPDDRRVKRVQITQLGNDGMRLIAEHRVETLRGFLDGLSQEDLAAIGAAMAPLRALVEDPDCRNEVSR